MMPCTVSLGNYLEHNIHLPQTNKKYKGNNRLKCHLYKQLNTTSRHEYFVSLTTPYLKILDHKIIYLTFFYDQMPQRRVIQKPFPFPPE
jgi:hypothetical protein